MKKDNMKFKWGKPLPDKMKSGTREDWIKFYKKFIKRLNEKG